MKVATCAAPTNIAVVKYWGKDDARLNTPLNSSVSVTLDARLLSATTSVAADASFALTQLWLNGEEVPINARTETVIRELRALARDREAAAQHLRIVSENSFPTAAGLASSAAGFACLVAAIAEVLDVHEEFPGQLSTIARQGSGSACRSLAGGFVRWEKGDEKRADGSNSIAVQVADEHYWSELCAIVCVVNDRAKDTSSTSGMQHTKRTSELLRFRVDNVVPERLREMEAAYLARDFATFGKLTMQDSNQFHATCLDTYPPIFYMNDVSKQIVHVVHRYNEAAGRVQAAYTFDAGPNAVIFVERPYVQKLLSLLLHCFPPVDRSANGIKTTLPLDAHPSVPDNLTASNDMKRLPRAAGAVQMYYVSGVGGGAKVLPPSASLIDAETGSPIATKRSGDQSQQRERWLKLAAVGVAATAIAAVLVSRRR